MGGLAQPKLTVEEYLALDRAADFTVAVGTRLRGRNCDLLVAPRTRVSPTKFVYPDLVVVCGEPKFTDEKVDTLTNPKVVVEILSPSTEGFDSHGKFALYRGVPSIEEYLLVAQEKPQVDLYRRVSATQWIFEEFAGRGAVVALASLGIELPLAEIYGAE